MERSKITKLIQGATVEQENAGIKPVVNNQVNVDPQEIKIKGVSQSATIKDHAQLDHLQWEKSGHTGFVGIVYGTVAQWDSQPKYIPPKDLLVVYTDYKTFINEKGETVLIPGFKLGDGNAYLIDKPFLDEATSSALEEHIRNREIHITGEERQAWNNKINCIEPQDDDTLIFTRN